MIFEQLAHNLSKEPKFHRFRFKDNNPLGGQKKQRWIYAPNDAMTLIHKRLMRQILRARITMPYSTCGMRGDQPWKNVYRHRKNRFGYQTDLTNAYGNVSPEILAVILCQAVPKFKDYEHEMFDFLEQFFFIPDVGLSTGGNASVLLFNIYGHYQLDLRLAELAQRYNYTYSRYLDDMLLTRPALRPERHERAEVRQIIKAAGFKANDAKTIVYDLKKGSVRINGFRLEYGGRIFAPRAYLRMLRGAIHRAQTKGDIPPSTIHGKWGAFWPSLQGRRWNRTEEKLVDQYRAYQKWLIKHPYQEQLDLTF